MSKKHKHQGYQPSSSGTGLTHEAEYRIIKFDLIRVVALNIVYLAAILALYYFNQRSHFLDNWFSRLLHF